MAELKEEHEDGTVSVEVELGFTKSMGAGSYEFLRVDIRRGLRGTPGQDLDKLEEFANEVTERLYNSLSDQLSKRVREIDEELGPKRAKDSKIHAKG